MKDKKIIQIIQEYKLILIGIIFSIICIFPTITNAVSVPVNYTNAWTYYRYHTRGGCSGPADFKAYTNFWMTLSKQFDLTASGVKTLAQNESTIIPTGVSLIATNHNVTGSYSYSSSDSATPPMDEQIYNWDYLSSVGACAGGYEVRNQMRGGISSQVGYNLTSSNNNIIDCSGGKSCTTKSDGTATVTVSFPGSGSYYVQRSYQWGRVSSPCFFWFFMPSQKFKKFSGVDCTPSFQAQGGDGVTGAWGYSLSPISYTMTVRNPNQAPTVNYTNTTLIEYNTATSNWSYSDPEGDAQTYSQIQVATDAGFNNIVFSNGKSGAAINMAISGLAHSTTYYPRVKVWNNANGASAWKNGPAFRTKVNNPPNIGQLSCGGIGT